MLLQLKENYNFLNRKYIESALISRSSPRNLLPGSYKISPFLGYLTIEVIKASTKRKKKLNEMGLMIYLNIFKKINLKFKIFSVSSPECTYLVVLI